MVQATDSNPQELALTLRRCEPLLDEHLRRLERVPMHGNRVLRFDQLVKGLLLSFFEPMNRSLRRIEDCGDFDGQLDLQRMCRSTTSDTLKVFDPRLLEPLIKDLQQRVVDLGRTDQTLEGITRQILAADGTYMTTISDVVWALHHRHRNGRVQGQVRANVQLNVGNWVPRVLSISGDDGGSEPAAFTPDVQSDVIYVVDRAFVEFDFLNAVLACGSDFVLRIKANQPKMKLVQSLALSAADVEAGVLAEDVVRLQGRDAPAGLFRCISIQSTDRTGKQLVLRLLTNLPAATVAAHVVGAIYRLRWQIELFFKWFKTFANMDHLLSTSRAGITTQLYILVIAVLMMHVQSGYRVSIYTLAALSRVARGQMSLDQAMAVIAARERERAMNRARQAKRRAQKKLV